VILPAELTAKAQDLLSVCLAHGVRVATAESCTGGLVAAALTAIPGSSQVFERGFIAYANEAKSDMLGVAQELIAAHGAVSEPVARAMAEGAIGHSRAVAALSVTGIAGPDGGTAAKPVGTVHVAAALDGAPTLHERHLFAGDRDAVRLQSALAAMELLLQRLCAFRA
jgi:nicotinamide-nucleotide amidase